MPEFTKISDNEIKFEYKGHKFLLVEQDRGFYSMGRAVQLYEVNGLKREHLKEIAWTKDDGGYGSRRKSDAYYKDDLVSLEACSNLAVAYLQKLL